MEQLVELQNIVLPASCNLVALGVKDEKLLAIVPQFTDLNFALLQGVLNVLKPNIDLNVHDIRVEDVTENYHTTLSSNCAATRSLADRLDSWLTLYRYPAGQQQRSVLSLAYTYQPTDAPMSRAAHFHTSEILIGSRRVLNIKDATPIRVSCSCDFCSALLNAKRIVLERMLLTVPSTQPALEFTF